MKTKEEILRLVLNSEEFKKHDAECKLLEYLVDASLKGETPDQTSIAIHALGRDASFDPNVDSIVRVRVHNLRKMLQTYYLTEGAHDRIRVTVSPRNYQVNFVPIKSFKHIFTSWYFVISIFLILILTLLNIYQWRRHRVKDYVKPYLQVSQSSFIWNEFLRSELPTLMVLGNNFFFLKFPGDTTLPYCTIRYSNINSISDLNQYILSQPDRPYRIEEYTVGLFENEIILSVHQILPIFYYRQKQIEFKPSTELLARDLQKYNIIYLGITKNLRILQSLLTDLNINSEMINLEHHFTVKSSQETSARIYSPIGDNTFGPRIDYVILDKLPGPNANQILIVTCTDMTGVYEVVKLLTHPTKSTQIENYLMNTHQQLPKYFESLLEVSSLGRTGFNIKPIHSFIINPDVDLIKPEITN